MGKTANPLLYKAALFAYIEVGPCCPINYSEYPWYEEKKVVYSVYDKVIAYVGGYRTEFRVTKYEFHNVPMTEPGIKKLQEYCAKRPHKYAGWLHHINFYSQVNKSFVKQVKL